MGRVEGAALDAIDRMAPFRKRKTSLRRAHTPPTAGAKNPAKVSPGPASWARKRQAYERHLPAGSKCNPPFCVSNGPPPPRLISGPCWAPGLRPPSTQSPELRPKRRLKSKLAERGAAASVGEGESVAQVQNGRPSCFAPKKETRERRDLKAGANNGGLKIAHNNPPITRFRD